MKEIDSQLSYATINDLAKLIQRHELSPVELTALALERIQRLNPKLNAFVTQTADIALKQAKLAEKEIMRGQYKSPLHGIPIVHKDLYYTKGIRTTAGSKILNNFVPDYDATAVVKLHEAGAVLLGKVQTHEFAAGMTTSSEHFGPCRNPWNPNLVPGGSSGGSAAAVAAGFAYLATGSDTGGSIRIPAACCGVVGMKPTFGRVSRYGIIEMSWSLDHAGLLTRSVMDASLCLDIMSGRDSKDKGTVDLPLPGIRLYPRELKGVCIGLPMQHYYENLDPEVQIVMQAAINKFRELGAKIVEVDIPSIKQVQSAAMNIMMGEMLAVHKSWLDTCPDDYGSDVRMFLNNAKQLQLLDYLQAQRNCQTFVDDFLNALSEVDILLTPATPLTAPTADNYEDALRLTNFTVQTNLTGMPSLSMPCGFSSSGMPVNMQLIGRPFDEATLLGIGYVYELNTDWHTRHPDL